MNLVHVGTDWGGAWVDLDLIPENAAVINAGVAKDVSFLADLYALRKIRAVGVDTGADSILYAQEQDIPDSMWLQRAVSPQGSPLIMYKPDHPASSSAYIDHRAVTAALWDRIPGISVWHLRTLFNPVCIKVNIEGTEYEIYRDLIGVKQLVIEWHHGIVQRFTEKDTERCIADLEQAGYRVLHRAERDVTFAL